VRRSLLCLAAAACCCLALLVPSAQGRLGIGLAGGFGATNRRTSEQQRGTAAKAASTAWSSSWTAAAGRVRPELRSVLGGPDPLHHHGSPWRPELEPTTP
ncbi:hypothetical protein PVAP13_8NG274901, partial [Panicum virgatum]